MAPLIASLLWRWKGSVPSILPKAFSLVFLLILTAGLFNEYWYQRDPGWRAFNRFDRQRLALMDYRLTRYDDSTKPYFDSVGWSQNDYQMFMDWCYLDPVKYSSKNLEKLAGFFPQVGTKGKNDTAHSISDFYSSPFCRTLFLYLLVFLLFNPPPKLRLLSVSFLWIIGILVFLMLFYRAPERIYAPAFSYLLCLSVFYADAKAWDLFGKAKPWGFLKGIRYLFLVLVCLFVFPTFLSYRQENQRHLESEKSFRLSLRQLNPQPDQLFVVWGSSMVYEMINALDDYEIYRPFHFFSLAVYQRSPIGQEVLNHFRIKNLLREMPNHPKVFLICSIREGMLYGNYMEEKFKIKIQAHAVFRGFNFNVYQIVGS